MRLKLIGLCSVCALVFGCVWANVDVSNRKANLQNLWKKTAKKVTQSKLAGVVDQASEQKTKKRNKAKKNKGKISKNSYVDQNQMLEEESVWTIDEEQSSKQPQRSARYDKNKASWRTKEEQEKYEDKKAWQSERNKKKNTVSGSDLTNLFREPYQRTEKDQRISDERKARRAANNKVLDEDLGGIFEDLSEEEAEFLTNVKKIVSHGGDFETFQKFLKTYEGNVNVKDSFGDTALIIALENREDELMKCLVENGADVNLSNDSGDSPINIAVAKNRVEIVDYLIENGAEINSADTVNGDTPLIMAVRGGFEDMIAHLIGNGADVNQKNKLGQTPLMVAVQQGNDLIIDKLLSENTINLEIQDEKGYTSLMHATDSNNVEAVEKLIRAGANPEAALNIAQNKNNPKKDNVQKSNQNQKTRLKGGLAERAAMLEQHFQARVENQGQMIGKQKSNKTAEKKAEEKAKREEIIRILKNSVAIQ